MLGLAVAPVIADYAGADPSALWQAAGATAAFVAGLGAYGYATRRDLSSWARPLFWALLALIVFGIVAIFVSIPGGNVIYAVAGLVIFGGFTIFDFNRLRRSTPTPQSRSRPGSSSTSSTSSCSSSTCSAGRRDEMTRTSNEKEPR